MKHIVRKPYWNYEKEERWLNEMSAKGLAMCDYSWCRYVFEDKPKGEYIYRIELLEHNARHPESRKYIEFLEETGVEFVSSYLNWVYFRKKAADGPFDLYSDIYSKIRHYKRVSALWLFFAGLEFFVGAMNLAIGIIEWDEARSNLICGISLLVICAMFLTLALPIRRKMKQLKKEKKIRES
jgi:hypothetical protein